MVASDDEATRSEAVICSYGMRHQESCSDLAVNLHSASGSHTKTGLSTLHSEFCVGI